MDVPRISASSYSNTAPLIWSFLYGQNHGKIEIILDTAPARSAELLTQDRVDAALVPVIAYQFIDGARLIPDVCVGAKELVRSVCLVTRGQDLADVKTVSLDVSSRTSVVLTKIIFREFLGFEPEYRDAEPDVAAMLSESDCALIIGDPALSIADDLSELGAVARGSNTPSLHIRKFDLANLWRQYTGFGFVFAMWMTRRDKVQIDFAAARYEGLAHIDEIVSNYESEIPLSRQELKEYLSENISYSVDDSMRQGMKLYFSLAKKNGLLTENKPIVFT